MAIRVIRPRNLIAVSALSLIGCGGDATSGGTSAPAPSPTEGAASFAQIQTTILTPSCATANCHVGAGARRASHSQRTWRTTTWWA